LLERHFLAQVILWHTNAGNRVAANGFGRQRFLPLREQAHKHLYVRVDDIRPLLN